MKPRVANPQSGYEKGKLYHLKLALLVADPDQPRKYFDALALTELQASILSHGVLQPILVREGSAGKLFIVSGERRYQAAITAGLETIPAIFIDGDPAEIAIIENLVRENLTAIEEAEAIERLRALHGYAFNDLAAALGKAESTLSEILSLNRLPQEVKDDCRDDPKVARGILTVIARQKTPEKMTALYRKYKSSGLTRGEIIKQTAKPRAKGPTVDAAILAAISDRLDRLAVASLTAEQQGAIIRELVKLRSVAYQKLKMLKG